MTKFRVEREALSGVLAFLKRYTPKDATIPVLTHVRLDAANSAVTATVSDLDQAARTSFPAEITEAGSFCLPANLFRKAIDASNGAEVSLHADDRIASVECGKQKFSFAILPAADLPSLPMLDSDDGKTVTLDAGILRRVVKEVAFAVEDPRGAYFLTGVSWRSAEGSVSFSATDKRRLSSLSVPCEAEFDAIVPTFEFPDWTGEVSVLISERHIRFQCRGQVVASKLIEATYPDTKRIVPVDTKPLLFDRADFVKSLNRVALACDDNNPAAIIVGRDGVATLSVESPERKAADEIRFEGQDFQIAFDCKLIRSVVQSFNGENIEIGFVSHNDTATVRDPADDTRMALAFPYRDSRLAAYVTARREAA